MAIVYKDKSEFTVRPSASGDVVQVSDTEVIDIGGEVAGIKQSIANLPSGEDGATFKPVVEMLGSNTMVLSWINDKGLPNPDPVTIIAPSGASAYDQAVEAGYSGTEEEFSALLADAATKTYVDEQVGDINTVLTALRAGNYE